MKKKQWKTPQLTVLYKSRTEESVLTGCKVKTTGPSNGPGVDSQGCGTGTTNCAACQSRGASGS
jgi:hypothetical protein